MGTLTYGFKHRHKNAYKTGSHWSFLCFLLISSFYVLTSLDIKKCFTSVGVKPANKPMLLLKQWWVAQNLCQNCAVGSSWCRQWNSQQLCKEPSRKGLPCTMSTALHGKHGQHPNPHLSCRKHHCWINKCPQCTETQGNPNCIFNLDFPTASLT